VARRATAIKALSVNAQGTLLILDAGNSLSGQFVSRMAQGQDMVEVMNAMGYDAMGIGQMDTMIGLEALRARQAEARFALLSANLVSTDQQEPYFDPYVILERDGLKIAILGISGADAAQGAGFVSASTVADATETARKYVAELRPQVDAVIVLSLLGIDNDKLLAEAVPGINVIVGGVSGQLMQEPTRVGNTLIVQQGYNGEWMGVLQASFDAEGVPSNATETLITLGPEYVDDADLVSLRDKWNQLYPTPTPEPTTE
jgi:5'-nucleotidase / UDP-sugar diphosphatase